MLVQSTDCTHVCVLMLCLQYCWFFYQDKVRRSLSSGGQRHVGGHIATQATQQTEKDHLSSVEKMWHDICETVIAMLCKGPEHLHSYACAPPAHSVFTPAAHSCCSLLLLTLCAGSKLRSILQHSRLVHWHSGEERCGFQGVLVRF
jgi:hypothetical protein